MTDTLMGNKQPDHFKTESPIRAFTTFDVSGTWAIGKGFRPSLAHLHTYLDAMQNKEGWHLIQLIDAAGADPTMVFQRDRIVGMTIPKRDPLTFDEIDAGLKHLGFTLIADPNGTLRYHPERKIAMHPALGAPYKPQARPEWMEHGSDTPIPDQYYEDAAKYIITRLVGGEEDKAKNIMRDFRKRFAPPKNHASTSHTTLAEQLEFLLPHGTKVLRIKQLIDAYREEHRLGFRPLYHDYSHTIREFLDGPEGRAAVAGAAMEAYIKMPEPNVGDDPINPAYYDGTACAEIMDHMPTNIGIPTKYVWRLGEKDDERQERDKAIWYLKRELALHDENPAHGYGRARFGFATPRDCGWYRRYADERIDKALKAGKLSDRRALFVGHMVSYIITGHPSLLNQGITFLEGDEA